MNQTVSSMSVIESEDGAMARPATTDTNQLQCYTRADESDLAALPAGQRCACPAPDTADNHHIGWFIPNEGMVPAPYDVDLGAVLHLDGVRALPANVTVSKVVGRIYNRHQEVRMLC